MLILRYMHSTTVTRHRVFYGMTYCIDDIHAIAMINFSGVSLLLLLSLVLFCLFFVHFLTHGDVMTFKRFPHYHFERNGFFTNGSTCGAWIFPLFLVWTSCWYDDVIKWKHFPRYWPFVQGINRSWLILHIKASDVELWCFLWSAPEFKKSVNNHEAGDWRRHRAHYDVIVMDNANFKAIWEATRLMRRHCNRGGGRVGGRCGVGGR